MRTVETQAVKAVIEELVRLASNEAEIANSVPKEVREYYEGRAAAYYTAAGEVRKLVQR